MLIGEWVKERGRGAITFLQRQTGLSYSCVYWAARNGALSDKTAERISSAIGKRNGEWIVSPAEARAVVVAVHDSNLPNAVGVGEGV